MIKILKTCHSSGTFKYVQNSPCNNIIEVQLAVMVYVLKGD